MTRKTVTFPAGGFEIQVQGEWTEDEVFPVFSCEHAYLVTGGVETPAVLLNITDLLRDIGASGNVGLLAGAKILEELAQKGRS